VFCSVLLVRNKIHLYMYGFFYFQEVYPKGHNDTFMYIENLAVGYRLLKDMEKAKPYYWECCKLRSIFLRHWKALFELQISCRWDGQSKIICVSVSCNIWRQKQFANCQCVYLNCTCRIKKYVTFVFSKMRTFYCLLSELVHLGSPKIDISHLPMHWCSKYKLTYKYEWYKTS